MRVFAAFGSAALAAAAFAVFGGVGACGTDAQGIEACRTIEEARCRRAPSCGVDLSQPVHRDAPKTDVDACIRYYHDACLHGLETPDPGGPSVQACVAAIQSAGCDVVLHPESNPSCAFLTAATAADAGADAPPDAAPDTAPAADTAPAQDAASE